MKDFNEPIDGVVYGITSSLGFATLENLYYVYFLTKNMLIDMPTDFVDSPSFDIRKDYRL